jgi:RNA 2',3'-cyclic 3'-phosphodiesterase
VSADRRLRLFVALELPGAVRGALAEGGARVPARLPGVRAVPEQSLHVTLCFLGAIDAGEVDALAAACAVALAGAGGPLALSLAEPVWLAPRRPRVLAVGLDDRRGELARLQAALAAALAGGGWYELERRPFLAHVTVARVRRGALHHGPELGGAPEPAGFTADRVSLYRSHTGAGGARYEALATIRLSDTRTA